MLFYYNGTVSILSNNNKNKNLKNKNKKRIDYTINYFINININIHIKCMIRNIKTLNNKGQELIQELKHQRIEICARDKKRMW